MQYVVRFLGTLGRYGMLWAEELGQMSFLVRRTARSLPRMRAEPVAVQMVRFGIRAIPIVGLVNLFVGMIVAISMSGGYIVGVHMLKISPLNYIDINNNAVESKFIYHGLVMAATFGLIITIVACREGLKAAGGALGVGRATTTAVVRSIVIIIAA